jgi:hypothetical protein
MTDLERRGLAAEVEHLRAQRDDLQGRNTELVLENRRLRAALAAPQETENASDIYDRMAEEFRRATGFMAPGKDAPPYGGGGTMEERREAWERWIAPAPKEPPRRMGDFDARRVLGAPTGGEACPGCGGSTIRGHCISASCGGTGLAPKGDKP